MKRFILLLLSICLCFTAIPCYALKNADKITPSKATNNLKDTFADDLLNTYIKEDDGVIGIPVILTSFRRNAVESNGIVVLYVVGHAEERIGTDSDTDIVNDFLNEGYMVVVLDYLNNPKAVGLPLTKSAQTINAVDINSTKKYIYGYDAFTCYTVPSGNRIARNIYYFSLDTMTPYGVNEYIVETYNMYYAGKIKNNNGEYLKEATCLEECLKRDGTPINMDLSMFIVYPSNPECTVPVFCIASSWESTEKEISSPRNFYFTHALFNGYAAVIYDHEYIPMSRDDHFGYLDARFTLGEYTANRVHSAAVRRVRYLADTYGYDAEYMTVMGFSKSGIGAGMLADKNHEEKGEHKTLDAYCPEGKSPLDSPEEQPWLYYEGTRERISSDLTVVYSGAGAGICTAREFCITENSVPFASSIGTEDDTAGFKYHIPLAQNYLDNLDIESLFLSVEGVGHATPRIYSQTREADLFIVTWDFLDNHIRAAYRAEAPKVLYMFPKSGSFFDNMDDPIEIKFSRAMNPDSLKDGIRVIRMADNKVLEGEWTAMHGNTTFTYNSALIIPGSKYKVEITDKCLAANGVALKEEFTKTFAIAGDEFLTASKNTTTDGNVADGISVSPKAFGNHTSNLTFKREGGYGDVVRASLVLNRTNDQNTQLKLEADNFSLLHPVNNDIEIIDVSEYVKNTAGQEIEFNLSSLSKSGTNLSYDFESGNKSDFKYKTGGTGSPVISITNEAHSGNYAIAMTNRNSDSRVKLVGATGGSLKQSDLGLALKANFWIKPAASCSVVTGLYVESGTPYDAFDAVTHFVEAAKWTKINYSTVITQEMIDNNTTTFGISPLISCDVIIDDIIVEYDAGVTTFTSVEQAAASTKLLAPTLVLYTPKSADRELSNSAIVTSGELADTVIKTEEFYVDGIVDSDVSDTKKGYLKMPISALSDSANKYTLNFCVNTDGKSSVSVYGVLGDDSRFAENFDSNISWNNAFANDISGYDVETDKVFGGAAITTVETTVTSIFSIDVTSYVKSMKNAGYNAVTFIFVSNLNSEVITENFEKITEFTSYSPSSRLTGFNIGLTSDPDNPNNQVFYFDRSGADGSNGTVNAYYQCVSFVGYLGTNKKWTSADVGVKYTVSFKQYNVSDLENSGHTGAISGSNDLNYKSIPGVTRTVIPIDESNTTANKWLQVTYTFTVTEEHVNKYSNYTSIIVSTGWKATRIYVDDLIIKKSVGNTSIDLKTAPTLSDGTNITNYSLAATVDGANPDSAVTATSSLPVSKTGVSGVQGITKAYYTFDKADVQRIDEAKLTLNVEGAAAGQKILVYGLNATVEGDICWTTAYANTATNKMNSSLVSSSTPIEIALTDGTEYTVDVTAFVSELREDKKVSFAITAADGVDKVVIKNVSLNISGSPSDTAESEAKITKPKSDVSESMVLISAESNHAVEKYVTDVKFYVNGKLHEGEILKNGDTYHTYAKVFDGENDVYAVFTYTDDTTVTTETFTFEKVGEEYKKGDINGDGSINAADLAFLKKVIAGLTPLDSEEVKNSNVDEIEGVPNAADIALLKKMLARII